MKSKTIEETYQKKSQLEHVLHRPGMYIGDIDPVSIERWVLDSVMVKKVLTYSPGLYKIFDEIFTNATDHSQRDCTLKKIEVTINKETGEITVTNDGLGIPVEIHKEFGKYVPEIIFGEFHTSSNYDDTEARTVGGLNGYGSKLTNAFSKKFVVEICDSKNHYIQTWENNMSIVSNAKVTSSKKKSFVRISFVPDYPRFGIESLDEDTYNIFKTRVYDGSAITNKNVTVYFDNEKIPVKDFQAYVGLYTSVNRVYEKINDRWEVAVMLNPYDKFTQVSFVNGISTSDGGTHVDYIVNQIIYKLKEQLEKKHKEITIRPSYIKDNLMIFINCLIENPTFSSQTKENHVTKVSKFGSKCELSEEFLKKVDRLGITANVLDIAKAKETKALSKTDGKKQFRLTGIPKLDDANKAGGTDGYRCKLILTEGDSAKASAVAGLSVVGRDYYGIFPLRGKLLNVRDATPAQLLKNEEINNLKKILGLQQGKEYKSLKELRYGGIMIFTDADNDGSHIKGLIINFIHTFWPSLMKLDSFISSIITPIVKVTRGKEIKAFYNQQDFVKWKETVQSNSWNIKYYKGLGTSTASEAKEYFTNLSKQTVVYNFTDTTDTDMTKAFKKGFEDQRKDWIKESTGKNLNLDFTVLKQSISQFVNNELINFSIADLERSIPNLMDGFKPSQRKVLYGCLKRKLYGEVKVAQLSGYISEHTSYHHGEASLQGTIVNMAQDFVGSNNLNLLEPIGQFGTRLQGGKDSGSPRYIFTKLNNLVKVIFNETDNLLLDYLDDDGISIEPKYYIPVIPMVLVNGSEGIGTGYSTNIPCYNPKDIIENLKLVIADPKAVLNEMVPWYKGFKGTIVKEAEHRYITTGLWRRLNPTTIEITELPIGKWTQVYKEFLETLLEQNEIIDYKNNCDDLSISFKVVMQKNIIDTLIEKNEIDKKLKLTSSINTSNMHVFDERCAITKVSCPEDIIFRFYKVRKEHFSKRKKHLTETLNNEYLLLESKVKFIKYVIAEKIVVFNKKKEYILKQIKQVGDLVQVNDSWDYLLELKLWTFTEEKIKELVNKMEKCAEDLETIKKTTVSQMWTTELDSIIEKVE
uniref:DNA topoisomerase (ATP-hydrolyzing) n=1 Tax=viral metagenome TaxID=1070528 RepID=A0A6C0I804_9ZZZZ